MKKANSIKSVVLVSSIFLTSCRLTDFTIISTKNVSINVNKDSKRVTAKGWTVEDAIDNAIEKAGVGYDALMDGVVYDCGFRYKVKGTPIKTSEIKK